MEKLPARTGWEWIKQGFSLFRKQPAALCTLFLGYLLIMLGIGVIPFIGQLMPIMLIPVFSVAFMQGCATIDHEQRVLPALLASGFRKPAFWQLLALGVIYLLVAAVALGGTALVDGGAFWELITGQLDPRSKTAQEAPLGLALMVAVAVYIPAAMAFCFSAPLILWQEMKVGKALFYSFFAVLRELKAFMVFALSGFGLTIFISNIIVLVLGKSPLMMVVMLPVSVILTVIMHCSFYAAYRQIFGVPALPGSSIDTTA